MKDYARTQEQTEITNLWTTFCDALLMQFCSGLGSIQDFARTSDVRETRDRVGTRPNGRHLVRPVGGSRVEQPVRTRAEMEASRVTESLLGLDLESKRKSL